MCGSDYNDDQIVWMACLFGKRGEEALGLEMDKERRMKW